MPGQLGDAYLVLARVYDELGDGERAEWAYTAAIDAIQRQTGWTRELAKAYRWYGKFLKRIGRAEAALEAFELAADLAPSNQDSHGADPAVGHRSLRHDGSVGARRASGGAGRLDLDLDRQLRPAPAARASSPADPLAQVRITSRPTAPAAARPTRPDIPYICAAASSAKITTSGCTPTAPPISLGITMWPSIWWMNRNSTATATAAVGDWISATDERRDRAQPGADVRDHLGHAAHAPKAMA